MSLRADRRRDDVPADVPADEERKDGRGSALDLD